SVATPICFRLLAQLIRAAASRTFRIAGRIRPDMRSEIAAKTNAVAAVRILASGVSTAWRASRPRELPDPGLRLAGQGSDRVPPAELGARGLVPLSCGEPI